MNDLENPQTQKPLWDLEQRPRGGQKARSSDGENLSVSLEVMPALEKTLSSPCVFDFRDYREFLRQWFQYKKQIQPGYSGGMFAKKAGIQAHSLFSMVARGERNLGYATSRGFSKA